MSPFTIDPDVARAATIDKRFYLDETVWRPALERVFARSWQWIGDLTHVAAPLARCAAWPRSSSTPIGHCTSRTISKGCTSRSCTPGWRRRSNSAPTRSSWAAGARCSWRMPSRANRRSSPQPDRPTTASASPPTTVGVPESDAEFLSLRAVAEPGVAARARQPRSVFASYLAVQRRGSRASAFDLFC